MTILFEFTSVMNVWDQTCQAFVAGSGPFSDGTSKLVSRTIKFQVYPYEPNTSISEQFVSTLLTSLQQIRCLLLWIYGRQHMQLRLCILVEFFRSPVRNLSPRISLHDLPYRWTMRTCLRQVSRNKRAFLLLLQRSWIRNIFLQLSTTPLVVWHSRWVQPR